MLRTAWLVIIAILISGCAETRGSADITIPGDEPRDDRELDPVPWVIGLVFLGLVVGVIAAAAAGAGQRQEQIIVIRRDD